MKLKIYRRKITVISHFFALSLALTSIAEPLHAQGSKRCAIEANIDLVSQNVWRGTYIAQASIQPSITATKGNFEFTVWGSTALSENANEIDAILSYRIGNYYIGLTDYWNGAAGTPYNINHQAEFNMGYEFSHIPLTVEWNTAFDSWASSYIEMCYRKQVTDLEIGFYAGVTPWRNSMLSTEGFAYTKLSTRISKMTITKSISFKTSCELIYNPFANQIFMVAVAGFLF